MLNVSSQRHLWHFLWGNSKLLTTLLILCHLVHGFGQIRVPGIHNYAKCMVRNQTSSLSHIQWTSACFEIVQSNHDSIKRLINRPAIYWVIDQSQILGNWSAAKVATASSHLSHFTLFYGRHFTSNEHCKNFNKIIKLIDFVNVFFQGPIGWQGPAGLKVVPPFLLWLEFQHVTLRPTRREMLINNSRCYWC